MRSLQDLDLKGKKVLMRVDFNVPTDQDNHILDDAKIKAALPTIEYVLQKGARLILTSHLGRPKGKRNGKYSLDKVAAHLDELIAAPVKLADDCVGLSVEQAVDNLKEGEVLLLENVRYHEEEEQNDLEFSKELASIADVYVNDAFGTAHRAHASTAGVARFLPAYPGFLMEKEVSMLRTVLEQGEKPRMAILGGSKVSDKLILVENLMDKMDIIAIGGGMANTFIKAQGHNVGKSICENDLLEKAAQLIQRAAQKQVRLLLPVDVVVAGEISEDAVSEVVGIDQIPEDKMALDIGPQTIEQFKKLITEAQTIVWNGPLGVYEYTPFRSGTREITCSLAGSKAATIIAGGDTSVIVHEMGLEEGITHISTGGGATLEFLEGKVLPGVAVCEQ